MDKIDQVKKLSKLDGKRNTFLTFFFPPDMNFKKQMESVARSFSAIKHKNKRFQLNLVMKQIMDKNDELKIVGNVYKNGLIICCGLNNQMVTIYYNVEPPNRIYEYEYYYDYIFNVKRIIELFYQDIVIPVKSNEVKQKISLLNNDFKNHEELLVVGEKEILNAIDMGVLKEMFYFQQDDDDNVSEDFIEKIKNIKGKIFVFSSDDEHKLFDKYGHMMGYLRYPMN